jgi:hypothetical protein
LLLQDAGIVKYTVKPLTHGTPIANSPLTINTQNAEPDHDRESQIGSFGLRIIEKRLIIEKIRQMTPPQSQSDQINKRKVKIIENGSDQ